MSLHRLKPLFAGAALVVGATAFAQEPTVIGIASFGPHPALAQGITGFKEELGRLGYVEGKNARFVYSDANFTPAMIPQTLNQVEAAKPAVILTITTPVSQAAITSVADKKIPLVFAFVSDPVAAGLVPDWNHGSARFVGAASAMDYDIVLSFAKKIFPAAKKFGVLYAPGEANDVVAIKEVDGAARRAGLELQAVSVDAATDVQQRAQLLSGVDFVYAIGSSLVQSSMPAVASVTDRYHIPILSAETELIKKGVVAVAYAVSYGEQGAHAAQLAAALLKGAKPAELAPVKPATKDYAPLISRKRFTQLGKTIPASFDDCGCFVD